MKICFIPIDNRPVCYSLAKDICSIDKSIELFIPPREYLGGLYKYANVEALYDWLKNIPQTDVMIISLDTLAYGGLIPSRRTSDSYDEIKTRIEKLRPFLTGKKVYAFSSIMRISNNNYNEEEKEYWNIWGKKIFQYSYDSQKLNSFPKTDIPEYIIKDYLDTRKRNFEINKLYLKWQQEGLFDTLIFSKDDCAEYGFNVSEAKELEKLGGITKTGADEIPLTLLSRAINKKVKVHPIFVEPECKNCISNYEDVSIERSLYNQLELGGFDIVPNREDADILIVINNFIKKQGELVMGWTTEPYNRNFKFPKDKPFAVADVRYANGADNNFVHHLMESCSVLPEYGFSAWNTSANTIGSLLAAIKVKFNAEKYDDFAYKKLQMIRFLDDWAYQANIRAKISQPCEIKNLMEPYENIIKTKLDITISDIKYIYPWNRKFEVEIIV